MAEPQSRLSSQLWTAFKTHTCGTSVACPAAEGNGRRPRKLRKRKEINGTEEKLWKWEIWNFKVETSKLKLRSPDSSLQSWNCESEFESSNLKLQTAISDLSLQTSKLQTKAANCESWDLQTSICKLECWVRIFKLRVFKLVYGDPRYTAI